MPTFECGAPDCDVMVRANDAEEVVDVVQRHATETHDRSVDGERIRSRMTE